MQVQIKKTIKSGNSSAVVLPRSWLNKEVRVELVRKTNEQILYDVLEITKRHIKLKEIIGVYLVGSYAREEETKESDIDILIISDYTDKEQIVEGIYNILIVSYQLLHQKLRKKLFPVGQMIKEAKPLLNADYIDSIEVKVTKENVKWYLDTTKTMMKKNKEEIDRAKGLYNTHVGGVVPYSLILRLRTLYIIECLKKNKDYKKRDFLKLIKKIAGSLIAYEEYFKLKSEEDKMLYRLPIAEAEKLMNYVNKKVKEFE